MTTSRTRSTSTSSPAESPSTETKEATETSTTELQADGNQPENASLQADGSQPENADAQEDGAQQGDAAPAAAATPGTVEGGTPPLDPPPVATAGDPEREPLELGYGATVPQEAFVADAHSTQFVEVVRDVVETFYYPNTKRPAQRIVFTKGQVVPRSQIESYVTQPELV